MMLSPVLSIAGLFPVIVVYTAHFRESTVSCGRNTVGYSATQSAADPSVALHLFRRRGTVRFECRDGMSRSSGTPFRIKKYGFAKFRKKKNHCLFD